MKDKSQCPFTDPRAHDAWTLGVIEVLLERGTTVKEIKRMMKREGYVTVLS